LYFYEDEAHQIILKDLNYDLDDEDFLIEGDSFGFKYETDIDNYAGWG